MCVELFFFVSQFRLPVTLWAWAWAWTCAIRSEQLSYFLFVTLLGLWVRRRGGGVR